MIVRPIRRWALLLVASALAAGPVVVAPSAAAAAATTFGCTSGQPCVHVTFPDGGYSAVDVPASDLDSNSGNDDTFDTTYPLHSQNGGTTEDYVNSALSLRGLLALIPSSPGPDAMTAIVLSNADAGYRSTLQAGDLDIDPTPFEGGKLGPIFDVYGNDSGIEYIRPQRDTTDANGSDRFLTGNLSTTIDMQVYTTDARPLHPTVTVGKGPWKAGEPVTFSASFAADDPPHEGVTFAWTFARGDASTPSAQSTTTTNRYKAGGTYTASVEVSGTGPDGETYEGQSPGVAVQVEGKASKPGGKSPGGNGTGGKHHPTTGPDRSHRAHHAGSAPTGGQVAAPPAENAPPDTSGPTGTGGPTATGPTTPAPTAGTSDPASNTTAPRPGNEDGAVVQGVLINGSSAPAGGAVSSNATRVAISARRPAAVSTSFDARWLWFLAPILLLVGGALGERRRAPHRHGPQSRP